LYISSGILQLRRNYSRQGDLNESAELAALNFRWRAAGRPVAPLGIVRREIGSFSDVRMTVAAADDAIPLQKSLTVAPPVGERALRLDLSRGLALWLIFIDLRGAYLSIVELGGSAWMHFIISVAGIVLMSATRSTKV
jgi:hypothetical protein